MILFDKFLVFIFIVVSLFETNKFTNKIYIKTYSNNKKVIYFVINKIVSSPS